MTVNSITAVAPVAATGAVKESHAERRAKLKAVFTERTIESLRSIVKDSLERVAGCQKDPSLLNAGVWYANDHFEASRKVAPNAKLTKELCSGGNYYHGKCPEDFFEYVRGRENPITGYGVQHYRIKAGVTPSDALRAARMGLIFLDCTKAIHLAWCEAMLEVFGERKFNYLFVADAPCPLTFGLLALTPFTYLSRTYSVERQNAFQRGQYVYLVGVPEYGLKHINGEGASYSTVCTDATEGAQKFLGLGLPLDCTFPQIHEVMLAEYNRPPIGTAFFTDEMAKKQRDLEPDAWVDAERLSNHKLTMAEWLQRPIGHVRSQSGHYTINDIDIERIDLLAQASFEGGRKLFSAWRKIQQRAPASMISTRPDGLGMKIINAF